MRCKAGVWACAVDGLECFVWEGLSVAGEPLEARVEVYEFSLWDV